LQLLSARFLHDVLESMLLERFHLTSTVCAQCIRALVVHEIARVKARCPTLAIARAVHELSASANFMHAELSCIARMTVHVITETEIDSIITYYGGI